MTRRPDADTARRFSTLKEVKAPSCLRTTLTSVKQGGSFDTESVSQPLASIGSRPLLAVRLSVDYPSKPGVLQNVEFQLAHGEALGLVGQSGSGKSTLALSVLRLIGMKGGTPRGEIRFQGRDLMQLKESQMRAIRGKEIGLVLQSPLTALNPALTIGSQLKEAWTAHATRDKRLPTARTQSLRELLARLSLPDDESFLRRYPRQLSVGQAQRLLIAMSVVHRPALLIADEPTSALDAITQAEILKLFGQLNRELHTAVLYVSHDLLSVASLCHRVAILHEGTIVECASTKEIFQAPQHPYTRQLIAALPHLPF